MEIAVVPYDAAWVGRYAELSAELAQALGDVAVRIDHIGSTAIPNAHAKPIIDIQILVRDFEPFAALLDPLTRLGYVWRADNPDLTKRYFREPPTRPRVHIHVRRWGSWSAEFALLFRDYLRVHADDLAAYCALKYDLAERYRHDRAAYTDAKSPFIWDIMQKASAWSQLTGWHT